MKISELLDLEAEQINLLRARSHNGDNHASQVLLEHLRATSAAISQWKAQKDQTEGKTPKRKYTMNPDKNLNAK